MLSKKKEKKKEVHKLTVKGIESEHMAKSSAVMHAGDSNSGRQGRLLMNFIDFIIIIYEYEYNYIYFFPFIEVFQIACMNRYKLAWNNSEQFVMKHFLICEITTNLFLICTEYPKYHYLKIFSINNFISYFA